MKNLVFAFGILALPFSCRKDASVDTLIEYTDITPDTLISSVRGWASNSTCTDPVPADSATSLSLDLNKDQIMDVRIIAWHKPESSFCTTRCGHFAYQVDLEPLHTDVAFTDLYLKLDQAIDENSKWSSGKMRLKSRTCSDECPPYTAAYMGFRVKGKVGWIHYKASTGSDIIIYQFALNTGSKRTIRAGQKS